MMRIVIADDHAIVRHGLRQIVEDEQDMCVVGEAGNGEELVALLRQQPCDIVVLDVSMPGASGLDVLKWIKADHPRLPVLILSIHPEDQYAVRVLRSGAAGYMTKDSAPEELVKALRKVSHGGRYVSEAFAEKLLLELDSDGEKKVHDTLSDREYQVMCSIARGRSVAQIAEELSLSVKTISTYRTRILEKTKLRSNADIIHYAIQNNLLS